jgi:hypothetical protein
MRAEKLAPLLATQRDIPDRAWLESAARQSSQHARLQRLVRAERASSGRARCRSCRETIDKDTVRLALQMFEDGRFSPIGTIHAQCAEAYLGTADIVDRLEHLQDLDPELRGALAEALRHQKPAPVEAPTEGEADESEQAPGLAKTHAADAEAPARRGAR